MIQNTLIVKQMTQNTLIYNIYCEGLKNNKIRAWRTWVRVSSRFENIQRLVESCNHVHACRSHLICKVKILHHMTLPPNTQALSPIIYPSNTRRTKPSHLLYFELLLEFALRSMFQIHSSSKMFTPCVKSIISVFSGTYAALLCNAIRNGL